MNFGFYKVHEAMRAKGKDVGFNFLDEVPVGEWFNLYDFLHGHCDEFAVALSDYFGYGIECVAGADGNFIHGYCVTEIDGQKAYIDARGITTDAELFFDVFSDWCALDSDGRLYDLRGECRVFHYKDSAELYSDDTRKMSEDKDLYKFLSENAEFYRVSDLEKGAVVDELLPSLEGPVVEGSCDSYTKGVNDSLNFVECLQLLECLREHGVLQTDPEDSNRLLVYRMAGEESPEGWYSTNVHLLAQELLYDKEGQRFLRAKLEEMGVALVFQDVLGRCNGNDCRAVENREDFFSK